MQALQTQTALKNKITAGESVLGIFVKTPSLHIVEILSQAGFDFLILDAEHAPFSIDNLDQCVLAARAAAIPVLVRLGDTSAHAILSVLDMGAAGVLIPHISSAAKAKAVVSAARYRDGHRGFSASHRAAGYGTYSAADYIDASDAGTIVIGQIEDEIALAAIDEIAAVDGLYALFIGPADLSVSCGVESWRDPLVEHAIDKICASGLAADKAVGIFQAGIDDIKSYQSKGMNVFVVSTDQALLSAAAKDVVSNFTVACGQVLPGTYASA